ncbi:Flp pilus assembly complex ATPase component TadA [Candidatus Woesearchaeota archaeon]|nr:Flp pilus assembly complex ATPase component TadA [Candidatus Woesearchaeota archaeon]
MTIVDNYNINADGIIVRVDIEKIKDLGLIYKVNIPQISRSTLILLNEVKNRLITEVNVGAHEILDPKIIENLKERFKKSSEAVFRSIIPNIPKETVDFLTGSLLHEMLGLDEMEFLLNDDSLEEIVITSSSEPVRVYHRKYGWLQTNITIKTELKIQNYANTIARRVGRQITTLSPLLDAHLVTGDRANAVLYPISNKGNTITIRKFARDPWTVTDLIKNNTCSSEIFALIWLAIQYEMNILISGGTASGKTSFLNVCMPFMPPNHRIISIEDTRELLLPKFLYWVPLTVRQPNPEGKGEVCMYPGSFIVDGKGELREISRYVEEKLSKGNKKIKSNLLASEGDGDTILAGDPLNLKYKQEKIKAFSKITNRKYICDIFCRDGTKFSITENTKLPILTKEGKISLLNPFEIKKIGGYVPLFTKININAAKQEIKIFDVFDKKGIYAYQIKDDYLILEKDLRKKFKLKEIAKLCGVKRQCFNYYRKTGIVNMQVLKKMIELSDYSLDYFENKIMYLKGRGKNSNFVKIPRIVDEDLAYFAGFVLAEKFINKDRIMISQKEEISYILKGLVKKLFGLDIKYYNKEYNKYCLFSSVITCLMKELFNATYAKSISVSKIIMRSQEKVIASFLAGYIDGDGSISKGKISLFSINQDIINEFKYLFLRLGILSTTYNGGKTGFARNNIYALNILSRKDVKKTCALLEFRKESNIEKAKLNLLENFKEGTIRNRIPVFIVKDHLETLKNYLNKDERYNFYYRYVENDDNTISRDRLNDLVSLLSTRVHTSKKEEKSLNALSERSKEEVEYVKIEKVIIKKNLKNIPSYDITPEDSKYFLAGSGNFTLVEDTMLDLLVNSLRMRPDRIILGEIRKHDQAEVLFEAMHTGHSVYATVHANSISETIRRLVNPPISVPNNLLGAVNLNVVMFRDRRKALRRLYQLGEFIVEENEEIRPNILYRWKTSNDTFVQHAESIHLFEDLNVHTGMTTQELVQDLKEKNSILRSMVKKNIRTVDQVGEIMNKYYVGEKQLQ